jgi:hypothetical protein
MLFSFYFKSRMLECLKNKQKWCCMQIGSLKLDTPIILAPMAGITNLPYRLINKKFGAGLVTTEMVSANGLIRDGRRTFELLQSDSCEHPLAVQLFGDDPQVVAEGVRRVTAADDVDAVRDNAVGMGVYFRLRDVGAHYDDYTICARWNRFDVCNRVSSDRSLRVLSSSRDGRKFGSRCYAWFINE